MFDVYKKVVDVNLWGLIDVIKIFLLLVKKVKGWIVIVSSIVGNMIVNFMGVGEGIRVEKKFFMFFRVLKCI